MYYQLIGSRQEVGSCSTEQWTFESEEQYKPAEGEEVLFITKDANEFAEELDRRFAPENINDDGTQRTPVDSEDKEQPEKPRDKAKETPKGQN